MLQCRSVPGGLLERRLQIAVLIMFMGLSLLGGSSISGSLAGGGSASISSQASEVLLPGSHPEDSHIRQAWNPSDVQRASDAHCLACPCLEFRC